MAESRRKCIKYDWRFLGFRKSWSKFADNEDLEEFGDVVAVLLKFGILERRDNGRGGLFFEEGLRDVVLAFEWLSHELMRS